MIVRSRTARAEIDNPAAYDAAIARNIKFNAAKTRRAKWLAVDGNQRLQDWLYQSGEFAAKVECSAHTYEQHLDTNVNTGRPEYIWCDCCREVVHPIVKGMFTGDFGQLLFKMQESLMEWGGLSDKQTELVRNALARAEKWHAERQSKYEAKRAEEIAQSNYVGEVGKREVLKITVQHVVSFENDFGTTYINICKDENGNVVVYKGSKCWKKDEVLTVKATIKAHGERNGVKQTMIQRPTVQ